MAGDPKRTITVESKKTIDRLSRRPAAYLAPQMPGPLDGLGSAFPWDIPSTMAAPVLSEMDRQLDTMVQHIDFLRQGIAAMRVKLTAPKPEGETPTVVGDPAIITFDQARSGQIARKDNAAIDYQDNGGVAQLAPDAPPPPPEPEPAPPAPASDWTCPEHGQAADAVSRKGRAYRYCPVCGDLDRTAVAA